MRQFLFLLAVVALSSAAPKPGGYNRQSYNFNQESATFKDNELQHKNEESGQYSKFEDLGNVSPPQVQSSYQQSEYNAPEANSDRWTGVKGRPRMYHSHHQHQGTYRREYMHGNEDWRLQNEDQQENHGFGHHHHQHNHGGHGRNRVYYQEEADNTGFDSQSHTLQQSSNSGSLYQHNRNQAGSGRDYWLRTEGQSGRTIPSTPEVPATTENIKPVYELPEPEPVEPSSDRATRAENNDDHLKDFYSQINQIAQMDLLNQQQNAESIDLQKHGAGVINERRGQRPHQRSYNSEWTVHGQTQQNTQDSTEQETQTDENITEDLTQQSQDGFDDLTQQTQHGFEDLTQQSQSGFDDLTQQTQQTQDLYPKLEVSAQQKDLSQQHEEQTQGGFELGSQQRDSSQQRQTGLDLTQQHDDLTQQTQDGFGSLEFGQQHEDLSQQAQTGFGFGSQQRDSSQQRQTGLDVTQQNEDLTQQTQDGFDKLEFGQQHEDLTQQTQTGFEIGSQQRDSSQQRQTGLDLTQQTQDGFDKLEFGQQHEDLTQQTQTGFEIGSQQRDSSQQRQTGLDLTQQHEDLTQQTQDGFDKLEFGQQHEDLTQQTQTGFGFGSQQRDSSQQRQTGLDLTQQTQQHEDLTQQTQAGFELGSQQRDSSQQRQTGYGRVSQQQENLNQQHEDLTQQTQDGFGTLELGQQHEDLTQQHQQTEDLTQQTQSGFELGSQQRDSLRQTGRVDHQGSGLTQQTQDGFGQLELGSQHQQNDKDFTQQTQDGFGRLETQNKEEGQFEFGQQPDDLSVVGLQQGRTISQSHSNSYSHSSHQQQSNSGSYSRTLHYGQVSQIPPELTTQDLRQQHVDQQVAQQVQDVSQQVQKVEDLNLEEQKEFNRQSNQELLGRGLPVEEEEATVTEIEVGTTIKPGFWKRVGSSISSTYESAKEKSKTLAEKVKQNLG